MLYIGFKCFLRTSEMLALQMCHLIPHASRPEVAVVIPFAKTSNGNAQVLTIQGWHIWALGNDLQQSLSRRSFLWSGTTTEFRKAWKVAIECLGCKKDDYTPYGIRRGGATWHFLEYKSMDLTLGKGRWTASKTARLYIEEGTLAIAKLHWKTHQKRRVRQWLKTSLLLFRGLPLLKKACGCVGLHPLEICGRVSLFFVAS